MSRHTHKYAALLLFGILILPNLVTCEAHVSARDFDDAFFVSGGDNTDSTNNVQPSTSEISRRLENIEKDLKTLKILGPAFLYLLSDSKRWYKLLLVVASYFFLAAFFYRKVRRADETKNDDAGSATDPKTQKTAVHSSDFCAIDIPASGGTKNLN